MRMSSNVAVLPPAKNVVVYRNGDPFFTGRRFVVNQRQVLTLESFLNEVTQTIQAPAAVRTLYTPREGHRVRELQDLQSGAQYVAAGFERFRKLDYLNAGLRKPLANRTDGTQAKTVYRPNISAKWRKSIHLPCVIQIFRNGDLLCPPFRLIIPKSLQFNLEQILGLVSEKASLRSGAVRRLCTLEGGTVTTGEELESGQYYVAVGTERFKKLPYVELLVPKAPAVSHRKHGKRRLHKRYETRKPVTVPQDRYSDSALLDSPESDGRRVKSTGDEAGGGNASQEVLKKQGKTLNPEEESLFYAKPVRVRKTRAVPRPPQPRREDTHPSVFKGNLRKKRQEMLGAQEVPEDEETAVDLPVDQRVAETVDDELLCAEDELVTPRKNQHEDAAPWEHSVGKMMNANTTANTKQDNARASFTSEAERRAGRTTPDSRAGHSTTRSLQENNGEQSDGARSEPTQKHENLSPESRLGSLIHRSSPRQNEAEPTPQESYVATNELAA